MFIVLVIFIFQEVFAQLNETSDSVSVSFFEIYNEKVFDLLGDNKVRILIRMKINSMLTILVLISHVSFKKGNNNLNSFLLIRSR